MVDTERKAHEQSQCAAQLHRL